MMECFAHLFTQLNETKTIRADRERRVKDPIIPRMLSKRRDVSFIFSSFSFQKSVKMRRIHPIMRNTHPQLNLDNISPDRFITSHLNVIRRKYTSRAISNEPTSENIFHFFVLTMKNVRISKRKVIYEGICKLVRGKGSPMDPLPTTGAIIPVKKLTTASIPACEREKVISTKINAYILDIVFIFCEMQEYFSYSP